MSLSRLAELLNRHGATHDLVARGTPAHGGSIFVNRSLAANIQLDDMGFTDTEFPLPLVVSQAETARARVGGSPGAVCGNSKSRAQGRERERDVQAVVEATPGPGPQASKQASKQAGEQTGQGSLQDGSLSTGHAENWAANVAIKQELSVVLRALQ